MSACNVITISLEKIVSILIDSLEIVSTFVVRITSLSSYRTSTTGQ